MYEIKIKKKNWIKDLERQKLELSKKNKKFDFKIFLKIRVFFKLLPNDIDTVSMYFSQHLKDFIDGRFPVSEIDAFALCALAMHAEFGPYDEVKDKDYPFKKFIPEHMRERNAPQVWIDKIILCLNPFFMFVCFLYN